MRHRVDTVLVKVVSRCNIDCSYCYVYNMGDEGWRSLPPVMSEQTGRSLVKNLAHLSQAQVDPFDVVLHGGEPLLYGRRKLERFFALLRESLPWRNKICIQTNGTLISPDILDVCAAYRVQLSVSLDGPRPVNDKFRIGKRGESTYDKVVAGIECLRRHRERDFLYSGLLTVIDPFSSPEAVYQALRSFEAPSLDFLYRDGNHSKLPFGKLSLDSTEYGDWLVGLLEVYLVDPNPPRVRILDDLIRLALGRQADKEGVGLSDFGILIVDTDGTIKKNDTLKSSFNSADRFTEAWTVFDHFLSDVVTYDEYSRYHALQQPSALACRACKHLSICGGGMPLHRWSDGNGYDNPSVYCADQMKLINSIRARLRTYGVAA